MKNCTISWSGCVAKKCIHVMKTSGVVTLQAISGTFGVSRLLRMWRNHAGSHLRALGGLEILGTAIFPNVRDWQTPTWTSHSLLPKKLNLQMENKGVDFATVESLYWINRGGGYNSFNYSKCTHKLHLLCYYPHILMWWVGRTVATCEQ